MSPLSNASAAAPGLTTVGMISLGCAKNLVDAEIMLGSVLERGMRITPHAEEADVLVVLSFNGLPVSSESPRPTTMKEVALWIETNAKPIPIGIGTSFVESGGGLAIAPSPREMGEAAMSITLDWLRALSNGEHGVPAIISNTHYRVAVRESALRARGIALPSIYLEAARLDQIYFP